MEKVGSIWLDGELVPWDEANVHILTHTMHYGLGVFEGIRAYQRADGRSHVFRLGEHMRRLFDGARVSFIDIPYTQAQLTEATIGLLKANNLASCYIRPLVFLGHGRMGLGAENDTRVAIAAWPWGSYLGDEGMARGIRVCISSFTRGHVNTTMCKVKIVGQYVNSVLAKREALQNGYDEAIVLDPEGYIGEGTGENIFIIRDGIINTPPTGASLLPGITRDAVIQISRDLGYTVRERRLTRDDLYLADEVFLTGTAAELTPVREVDGRTNNAVGPITKRLQDAFFDVVKGSAPEYEAWRHYY